MKVAILGLSSMLAFACQAQESVPAFPKLPKRFVEQSRVSVVPQPLLPAKPTRSNAIALRKQKQVVILPQDGMACVIPADQHYYMPDGGRITLPVYPEQPGAMPNATTKK